MPSNWLFAPMNFKKTGIEGLSELTGMDEYISEDSRFHNADPITITLRGAFVKENMDARPLFCGKNDIMIISTFQFGKEPAVQKLHMMGNDVECGWQGDFFNRIILAIRDFKELNENLALRVQIYDLDKIDTSLIDDIQSMAGSVAVAFPALAPYAAGATFVNAAAKLADNIDDHDKIIDEKIVLESVDPHIGHTLLQQGYYICFRNPISLSEVKYLDKNLRVLDADKKEFEGFSYAVVEVHKDFRECLDLEIDQKVAKLASELNGKGQSGKAALDFLRETLNTYTDFKDLQRERELGAKKEGELTESEKKLLAELRSKERLKPYL
ncbi:MAG: hypothetical protein E4G89_05765 [Methanothrix sp.]|nr:MAG: hypothetical protein E4G89_05765 [Methanothrix sp.]